MDINVNLPSTLERSLCVRCPTAWTVIRKYTFMWEVNLILMLLTQDWVTGLEQRSPDLHSHLVLLIWGNAGAFPGEMSDVISPACAGFTWGHKCKSHKCKIVSKMKILKGNTKEHRPKCLWMQLNRTTSNLSHKVWLEQRADMAINTMQSTKVTPDLDLDKSRWLVLSLK